MDLKEENVKKLVVLIKPNVKGIETNKSQATPIQVYIKPPLATKYLESCPTLSPSFDIKHELSQFKIPMSLF